MTLVMGTRWVRCQDNPEAGGHLTENSLLPMTTINTNSPVRPPTLARAARPLLVSALKQQQKMTVKN